MRATFPFSVYAHQILTLRIAHFFLGCWTDPNAVRLKLSDDMDDGDKLLLTALLVDVLGNPGVGVDEEGNGTKKSNLCPIICVGGIICVVVVIIIVVVVVILIIVFAGDDSGSSDLSLDE